jgi:carbamoyltransferase
MATILGLHAAFSSGVHDPSAALTSDGRLLYAIEEERLNRCKTSTGLFPERSLASCLHHNGITINDIDAIAIDGTTARSLPQRISNYVSYLYGKCPQVIAVPHPIAHGSGSFYSSQFDESLVVTVDGVGDRISILAYIQNRNGRRRLLYKSLMPNSLGAFYTAFTNYLGFRGIEGEYKVMGMAAYGDPEKFDLSNLLFFSSADGKLSVDAKMLSNAVDRSCFEPHVDYEYIFSTLGVKAVPASCASWSEDHYDLAASVQKAFTDAYISIIDYLVGKSKIKNVCLSGGCALNCLANMKLFCERDYNIYIQPAASDRGLSIGSAFEVSRQLGDIPHAVKNMYLGNEYSDADVYKAILQSGLIAERCSSVATQAAEKILNGSVIGWFMGRSEFGPRALGARSILAAANIPGNRDRINEKIKFRELFRPFAPAILLTDLSRMSGVLIDTPYMTTTLPVLESAREFMGECCHNDLTARFQTVSDPSNPLYELLSDIKRRTGVGIVINTSFNLAGEPIVETPVDALRTFVSSGLDYLFIGSFMVSKSAWT